MSTSAPLITGILERLEDHLENRFVIVAQGPEIDVGSLLTSGRSVHSLPTIEREPAGRPQHPTLSDEKSPEPFAEAIESLGNLLPESAPILLMPSWDQPRPPWPVTPLAWTIRGVLSAFPNRPVTLLVPEGFLRSPRPDDRRHAFVSEPSLVVGIDAVGQELGIHHRFSIGIVHVDPSDVTRFLKVTGNTEPEEASQDLQRLLRQGGGTTKHGFILRQKVPIEEPIWPDRLSPQLEQKVADLGAVGETVPLGDLADVRTLVHRVHDADRMGEGIPLVTGRSMTLEGGIEIDEELRINVGEERHLRAGDILVHSVQALDKPLVTALVSKELLPATTDQTVLVVRPKAHLDPLEAEVLRSFLASSTARVVLRANTSGPMISPRHLRELPVPVPDAATKTAIGDLRRVSDQLHSWADQATAAIEDLMLFAGRRTASARMRLFEVGATSRRRAEAASQTDSLSWQIRTLFPHPLAYCYRTVEAALPNYEGYRAVLRCAELALAYLAWAAVATVHGDDDLELAHVIELRDRQHRRREVRLSFGDYLQLVRQFSGRQSQSFSRLERWTPLEEVRRHFTDEVDQAVTALSDRRNDLSHFRDDSSEFSSAVAELDTLMGSLRFLTDYPLILVEDVRPDTLSGRIAYSYRSLSGDHPLVPIQEQETEQGTLERGSLYLQDRQGNLHLLRPFMVRHICPECGRAATFHLDRFSDSRAEFRAFEHEHTLRSEDQTGALRAVGLISED